jgi:hypothetical protein
MHKRIVDLSPVAFWGQSINHQENMHETLSHRQWAHADRQGQLCQVHAVVHQAAGPLIGLDRVLSFNTRLTAAAGLLQRFFVSLPKWYCIFFYMLCYRFFFNGPIAIDCIS